MEFELSSLSTGIHFLDQALFLTISTSSLATSQYLPSLPSTDTMYMYMYMYARGAHSLKDVLPNGWT